MSFDITVEGGKSKRLLTAGKYCDRDIVVTATGGGVDLPELTNPATAGDLMAGKQMINGEGEAVDGTFTLETEMTEQDSLIEQIKEALKGKTAGGGSGDGGGSGGGDGVVVSNADVADLLEALNAIENLALSFPCAIYVISDAFSNCSSLKSINLPSATTISPNSFDRCVALESVNLPLVEFVGSGAFDGCSSLNLIDLPAATSIGDGAFYQCTNLSALILRNTETVCQLIVTAVLGTKIATEEGVPTGEGFVYVPSALYEGYVELLAYQAEQLVGDAATAEYIARAVLRKIEDYPEICG